MDKKDLARLVERANKGDAEAFAQIYNEFYNSVFYIGYKITGNEHDAGDVLQETMLRLHKRLVILRDPISLVAFVNRTATNISIDLLRAKNKMIPTESEEEFFVNARNLKKEFLPQEALEDEETRDEVIAAVEDLDEDQKAVILLFYYQELSVREISKTLGITESLTKTRLSRARQVIKRKLESFRVREAMMMFVPKPILTQILKMDAASSNNKQLSAEHWIRLATKLNIPPEVAEQTVGVATTGILVAAAKGALTLSQKIIVAVAATVVVGGGAAVAVNTPIIDMIGQQIASISNAILSDQAPLAGIDIPSEESPSSDLLTQNPDDTSSNTGSEKSIPRAGATTPARPSGTEGDDEGNSQNTPSGSQAIPGISYKQNVLRYQTGTALTLEKVLTDAGISAAEGLIVKTSYFDTVDTAKPDDYSFYVWAENQNGERSPQIAIIIIIK